MKKTKSLFKKICSFVLSGFLFAFSITGIINQNKGKEKNIKEAETKWFVTYKTADKPNLFNSEAEIFQSYSFNDTVEEDTDTIENTITNDQVKTNNTATIENAPTNDIEPNNASIDNQNNAINIDLTYLEEKANILGESIILNYNPRYIDNVTDYLYDIDNDNITSQYKLNYIEKLYNINHDDLFILECLLGDKINENPTTPPNQILNELLTIVIDSNKLKNAERDLINKYNLNEAIISIESDILYSNYINNINNTSYKLIVNKLFYKLFDLPLEWKLNYIYKRWNIEEDELITIIKCMLCEAKHHSYIDTYFVTNVLCNRTYSKKWTENFGNDIYLQLIERFGVYYRGDYKIYGNISLDDLLANYEGAQAVIDCLVEGGIAIRATNFWGNGYESKDKLASVENGNNFYNENGQMESEDLLSMEKRYPIINGSDLIIYPSKDTTYTLKK